MRTRFKEGEMKFNDENEENEKSSSKVSSSFSD